MLQAGWMRLRLRPAYTPLSLFLTRPGCLSRVHSLPVHLVRDTSSFHRHSVSRTKRGLRHVKTRSRPDANSVRTDSQTLLSTSSQNTAVSNFSIQRSHSRNSLYKNLLRLLSSRSSAATLPALLDYHELHPSFRSVRSYNLLVSLAIRHVAFGTVQSLLAGMAADRISGNLETQKLKIRWSVRSGLWEHAWTQVANMKPIPLPLWLEFFHGAKAGALAKHPGASVRVTPPQTRFQILMKNLPTFMPNNTKASARAVRTIVRAMLDLNKPHSALTLATRYLNGLPRHVGDKWAQECIDIIDGIVAFESKRRGLLDFYRARRNLNSLLAIHPSFRPSPKTLYLLLATLRQAKQCGTIAWDTLTRFKTRWGGQVENRRVRRRVASYAIKEGRLEIVEKVFDAERRSRQREEKVPTEPLQLAPRPVRLPFRELFPRTGNEEGLWRALKIRAAKLIAHAKNKRETAECHSNRNSVLCGDCWRSRASGGL
ncbi:hypothetical protein B0H10DRAFT_967125 [Mycena sp. CBHHK59/15]|nr:hypothetical protein B0H10DRAFT_967125 [Mycena sp. CBHHK59/15]